MENIVVSALTALVVSSIFCKISAVYIFSVIDGHVEKTFELIKKLISDTYINK